MFGIFKNPINLKKASTAGALIALGIVFGDIGTSPLYVMQAILSGVKIVDDKVIFGAISCIIWTLTLQTTIKYVVITLRADNNGEGGVFALYTLVRSFKKWAYVLAIIGSGALLADGIITPSITITSAIEGLRMITPGIPVIPIVVIILSLLFLIQQFGTQKIGNLFGPVMFFWFAMLGVFGIYGITLQPAIFKAFNPYYAFELIKNYPGALVLMGAVFLATTGAEALYSDLGHCGAGNIRRSWIYVKTMLVLNYLGQGAYVLTHSPNNTFSSQENPFFSMMPHWFLIIGIIMATFAAIIASQALITGSYTLISEAIHLKFFPRLKLIYPAEVKGQVYIPFVNVFLWLGCLFVVFHFGSSQKMQAAYGLAITLSMLVTTTLLTMLFLKQKRQLWIVLLFAAVFFTIEGMFLLANLGKIAAGGWITLMLTAAFAIIMYAFYNGNIIKNRFIKLVDINRYISVINDLKADETIPLYAGNLVYITQNSNKNFIEYKTLYSILEKHPKRAVTYWFLHVNTLDTPYTFTYDVSQIEPGTIIRVNINLGFKVGSHIYDYFNKIVSDMELDKEINMESPYPSLHKHDLKSDFMFVITDRLFHNLSYFSFVDRLIIRLYELVRKIGVSEVHANELSDSNVIEEFIPINTSTPADYPDLKREKS